MNGWMAYGFQVLNLVIIIWLFRRYFFPQVREYIRRRNEAIALEYRQASQARSQAESMALEVDKRLKQAHEEATQITALAVRDAHERARRIEEEARVRSREIGERSKARAENLEHEAYERAAARVGEIALDMTTRVLQGLVDEEMQQRAVEKAIARLEREAGG